MYWNFVEINGVIKNQLASNKVEGNFWVTKLNIIGQSQSHITTDIQPASPSWCQEPIWDSRPTFLSPWNFI
jgi:hypothetical protein